jgi:peptidoglycan/xylan/chitin deacetylase (PgdA/CDA1 family)
MYHHVLPAQNSFISVSVDNFECQMKMISKKYNPITSDEFLAYKKGDISLPKNSIFITFDDGWLDNYVYAYPILKKYNVKATVFIVTKWIDDESNGAPTTKVSYSSHKEADKMVRSGARGAVLHLEQMAQMSDLVDFNSHLYSHTNRTADDVSFENECEKSQEFFVKNFGKQSKHLCHPWGYYEDGDFEIAKQYGFEICYTTKNGANLPDGKVDAISRFTVKDKSSLWIDMKLQLFSNSFLAKMYAKRKA